MTILKNQYLRLFITFVTVYMCTIIVWKQFDNYYQRGVVNTVCHILGWQYDFEIINVNLNSNEKAFDVQMISKFALEKRNKEKTRINIRNYVWQPIAVSFNMPISLSIMLCIMIFYKQFNYKLFFKLSLLIVSLHFLFFYFHMLQIFYKMTFNNVALYPILKSEFFFLDKNTAAYIRLFMEKYVMRFEPFLIGVLVWWQIAKVKETSKMS